MPAGAGGRCAARASHASLLFSGHQPSDPFALNPDAFILPWSVPFTVPGAPEASCARRGVPGRPRALLGWSRSTLQGASLAVKMLRRFDSAESRYTVSPLYGEPTAGADSPIIKSESESHPHTPLSCVRFRCLLGYHTRTPRVDKRNVRQLRAVC